MRKIMVENIIGYEVEYKHKKIINRLMKNNYIVIYDMEIIESEKKIIMASLGHSYKDYYKLIKAIYPAAYVTKNFITIGYK